MFLWEIRWFQAARRVPPSPLDVTSYDSGQKNFPFAEEEAGNRQRARAAAVREEEEREGEEKRGNTANVGASFFSTGQVFNSD